MERIPVQISARALQPRESYFATQSCLMMLLRGEVCCEGDMGQFSIKRSDVLFLQAGQQLQLCSQEGYALLASWDESFLTEHLELEIRQIRCNSAVYPGEYDELRRQLAELTLAVSAGGRERRNRILSMAFAILDTLSGFLAPQPSDPEQRRKIEIERYLRRNYKSPLSLQSLAKQFYLSPQYLSRYIKKNFGQGFLSILTSLRLDGAVRDLSSGNVNITQAALNNGFPNVSSFHSAFRERYGMSPKAYLKIGRDETTHREIGTDIEMLSELLEEFIPQEEMVAAAGETVRNICIDCRVQKTYRKSWQTLINLEQAASLLDHAVQRHVETAQKKLQFSYGRIVNLISPEVFPGLAEQGLSNFTRLNRIIDFMLSIQLKPFIELQPKPMKQCQSAEAMQVREVPVISESNWRKYMHEFFAYLCKRWGEDEVETWRFELWMPHNEALEFTTLELRRYVRRFRATADIFKGYIPEGKLGGPGLNLGGSSLDALENILELMRQDGLEPDFFSAYLFPNYISSNVQEQVQFQCLIGGEPKSWPKLWTSFVHTVQKYYKEPGELFVTEYGSDVTSRAWINDTCYKAAVLADTFMQLGQRVDGMGYWYLSDLSYDVQESNILLFGGNGLLSRNGIPKSAYHVFSFLKQQGKMLVELGENHMLTRRNNRHYELLVHNCKALNESYCRQLFAESEYQAEEDIFTEVRPLRMHLSMRNMRPGSYTVKKHTIDGGHGDLASAVRAFNCPYVMREEEQAYLAHTSVPLQRMDTVSCDGELRMELVLAPNEVTLYTLVLED